MAKILQNFADGALKIRPTMNIEEDVKRKMKSLLSILYNVAKTKLIC